MKQKLTGREDELSGGNASCCYVFVSALPKVKVEEQSISVFELMMKPTAGKLTRVLTLPLV